MGSRGPYVDEVAEMLDALRRVSDESLAMLARHYDVTEETERNAAWTELEDGARRANRSAALDELRQAAMDLVGLRASTVYGWEANTPFVRPRPSAEDQVRIVNSIIEAGGAILLQDQLRPATVEVLTGPVRAILEDVPGPA